ncbi:putative signal peptide protein [Puccinia sorghi]|uniref:Putative signal peptide protein n=1 Tax=Puccinia sorghi TaxID=27349 RepID=A0A0L6UB74_9BASI|nr:putative signal peptide protein [Puccinia sorghi]
MYMLIYIMLLSSTMVQLDSCRAYMGFMQPTCYMFQTKNLKNIRNGTQQ